MTVVPFPKTITMQYASWCAAFSTAFMVEKQDHWGTLAGGSYRACMDAGFATGQTPSDNPEVSDRVRAYMHRFIKLSSSSILDVLNACRWFDQSIRETNFYLTITNDSPVFLFTLGSGVYFRVQMNAVEASSDLIETLANRNVREHRLLICEKFSPVGDLPLPISRFPLTLINNAEQVFFEAACAAQYGYEIIREEGGVRARYLKQSPDKSSLLTLELIFDTAKFECRQMESPNR